MPKKSKTLPIEEIATKLNVSVRTVQNWIKNGSIKQIAMNGKSTRVSRSEIHLLLHREY